MELGGKAIYEGDFDLQVLFIGLMKDLLYVTFTRNGLHAYKTNNDQTQKADSLHTRKSALFYNASLINFL